MVDRGLINAGSIMTSFRMFLNFHLCILKKLVDDDDRKPVKWRSTNHRQLSFSSVVAASTTYLLNVDEMRQVFDEIDRDRDGKISLGEMKWLLKKTTKAGTSGADLDVEAKAILTDMKSSGGGELFLSFKDFMDIHRKGVRAGEIQRAFRVFDLDGDGRLGAEEILVVMNRLGQRCGIEECKRMVRAVDRTGVGLVDMDDFMLMMTSTSTIK